MTQATFLSLRRQDNGIVLLEVDMPGEAVNTLRAQSAGEFQRIFDQIEGDAKVQGVIICSAKLDNFIAGADISMLSAVTDRAAGKVLSQTGQAAAQRIASCRVPVVAAVHGACLGGGLELALACHARIASTDEKTKFGVPEVQLGILPGMGGTVRLPQTVGLSTALDLLLTGRKLSSHRALTLGLVSAVVDRTSLINAATKWLMDLRQAKEKGPSALRVLARALNPAAVKEAALADNPLGRRVVFDQAYKELLKKTHGNYPAPERILKVVRLGLERGAEAGFEAEATAFGELVVTPEAKALRHIYFAQQLLKKYAGPSAAGPSREISRIGIIGAGLMGQGIAQVSLAEDRSLVRIKDTSRDHIKRALINIDRSLQLQVERRKLSKWQRSEHLSRLTATTSEAGLSNCEIVIEAAFEDLELKRSLLAQVEQSARVETIFASNTSALSISAIAQDARHKDRVLGMHYFSPVERMPLLEIVVTDETAPWVIKQAISLGKKQGKTVIVVHDGPGFYTTRILAPYLNEAAHLLLEGHAVETIDQALVKAGFPVGPFTLLDEIGIDVGHKVGENLFLAFGERLRPPVDMERLVRAGRLGRKAERGFYLYGDRNRDRRPVDSSFYAELELEPPDPSRAKVPGGVLLDHSSVAERCVLAMVNEAARCLGEGILQSADDGDMGAIFGLGFPAYLGGPFHWVKQRGAADIVARLKQLQEMCGPRFEPAPHLLSLL